MLDQGRSGRPPVLDDTDVGVLLEAIGRNPHPIKVARDGLFEKTGKPVSRDTVKRTLKKTLMSISVAASLADTNGTGRYSARDREVMAWLHVKTHVIIDPLIK